MLQFIIIRSNAVRTFFETFFACLILNKLGYALFADFIFLQVFVALSNGDLICYARDHTKDSQWDFTNKKCLPGKLTSLFILCIHLYY